MIAAAEIGGWLAAAAVAALAMMAWRALGARMEDVARACHEARGPITAARLGLELGSRAGELSAARLRAIDVELGRASLALADLDAVRERRRAACSFGRVDLQGLLADSVEAWWPAAAAAGKQLQLQLQRSEDPVALRGDRLRLAQAVGNLIANAIEHGGAVTQVRGWAGATGVRIEVSDDGGGLPAPLAALTRRPRHGRGAHGRGLAIVAGIAGAHGGRLASMPTERGTRLVLELPRADPRPAAEVRLRSSLGHT